MASRIFYGGQAVIEGVMIRGAKAVAVACRRPDGNIVSRTEITGGFFSTRLRKFPLLRGIVVLWETMAVGMRALIYSSNVQLDQEGEELSSWAFLGATMVALIFVAAVLFTGPVLLANLLEDIIGQPWVVIGIEALMRLFILVAYLFLIGLMPEIRRVYAYHGAEHKSIHALEAGDPLEIESVQKHSVAHLRCGTSFLLTIIVVSVIIFVALGSLDLWLKVVTRIALIPLIATVAYEVIRLGATFHHHRLVRIIMAPNLMLQALTTRQPDDSQVEVAIYALKKAMAEDEKIIAKR